MAQLKFEIDDRPLDSEDGTSTDEKADDSNLIFSRYPKACLYIIGQEVNYATPWRVCR